MEIGRCKREYAYILSEEVTRLLARVSMSVIGVNTFTDEKDALRSKPINALLTCTIQGKHAAAASAIIVLAFMTSMRFYHVFKLKTHNLGK